MNSNATSGSKYHEVNKFSEVVRYCYKNEEDSSGMGIPKLNSADNS